ncbi:MAG: rod shape-determining protein [Lachnospiraceae bacterium]|nr:rod shape-determining protein [Lachnospiraceae bacterium]MBR1844183.1 rod shape-determining protein [Lachnospiraceae bacterium]
MALFSSSDIGIDLGTSSILVYVKGKGLHLKEPSVVAISTIDNTPIAYGEEARRMVGRTPDYIKAIKPLKHGVISNITLTEKMLKHYIEEAIGKVSLRKPRVVICVPAMCTEIEKKAVEDAAYTAGARTVDIIEEPLAAALGADIDVDKPEGNMIVDIGGGTTDIAVIALGGIVCANSIKIAGDDFDQAIIDYLKNQHHLLVGDRTAEQIKISLGRAIPLADNEKPITMAVKGRSTQNGYPGEKLIGDDDIYFVFKEPVEEILRGIKKVFELTPPELAADIFDKGIYLTGGGSQIYGMDQAIKNEIGVECLRVDDPLRAVILGIQKRIMMSERQEENS